ncbi:site-2 protease family protein [Roseovarius sp. S1116L3]|uniref:site-2 protease family protein n=1 Tax=Roseovarius roseus TaxID=3342636 RepID=UPI0037285012
MWGNAVRIARISGFDIKIDASWLVIAALIVWSLSTSYFPTVLPDATSGTRVTLAVIAMLGLFASLILHELSHAEVARRFDLHISGITLFLFGGVAELKSEPADGTSEFWIAIAGPIASLCIAATFWTGAWITEIAGMPRTVVLLLSYLASLNLILAVFNLLPAFPMDGGRVLRAWLWTRSGDLLGATRRATHVSAIFAYGFMALGLYAVFSGAVGVGLWPILIGLFVLATSRAALVQLESKTALEGRTVADLMTRDPWTAHPDHTLAHLVDDIFLEHGISFAPVVENGALLGYVDFQLVRGVDRTLWPRTTVNDIFEPAAPENTVAPTVPGAKLMSVITKTGRRKFLVVDKRHLVGVITLSDIFAYLGVFRELSGPSHHGKAD